MNKRKTYIRHPRLTEKPLILYPAGEYGRIMLKELRRLAIEPAAFCDASEAKIGTAIDGVAVQSLDSLLKRYGREEARYLINSAYNYPQIEARLTSCGVPLDCILTPDIYSYCDTGRIERPIKVSQEEQAQLKRYLLDLLCFFHKVCEKYGIPYYITSGTLLGAVRHKGFIPWDDDIDVAMLRKDYNRFYRVVQKELGDTYEIQEMPSRKNLGLKNSVLRLFAGSQKMMIMIDTFPIDYVFPFPNRFNLLQERGSMFLFRLAQTCRWYDGNSRFSKLGRFLRRMGEAVVQLCNCFDTGWIHYFIWDTPNMYKSRVYSKALIGRGALLEFEGHQFYGPEQYEDMLCQMFGERYMELPPQEKRIYPHTISELQFPGREDI